MRGDSRLSRMLHVLIHLGRRKQAATSEMIAKMLNTNPVVVRRTMAGLRERGYVQSEKGHGGGWTLSKGLNEITLLDVYEALERPELFCLVSASDHPGCLVELAVNEALEDARRDAEALLLSRFATLRLSDIATNFDNRLSMLNLGHDLPGFDA
ncbi:Rrf2 family transcriptional regulator [Peteryoungia ipomoeae]|uniref:Rrf2 family transcriptional regulator n=1 Tax=Peteryoungia ipomoeae TaxID=1210932 RepID=A0A4V4HMV6_9HYPH|nr:Rrf2 family transcriptional regulator [Peteryoungia ipomoeae]THV23636.1 Rrf2 family transcriptional regulator [Peteryoungia ipomoeae]